MDAFNKPNTVIRVGTDSFCCSYCSLGQVKWYSSKSSLSWSKWITLAHQTSSSSQNEHVLCIKSVTAWNFYCSLHAKASSQSFHKDTILCGITCPITKSLFHEHTLKYAEVVKDFTVTSDLREKQKLHFWIQMLVTARSLEGTIINYIYSCSP